MRKTRNYAEINEEGKLVVHTDNSVFKEGEIHTEMDNRRFTISSGDLMKIYGLLQDKQITCLYNFRESRFGTNNYMIVGENVENKRIMDMYVRLLKEVEELNNNRHWWERKIKMERTL